MKLAVFISTNDTGTVWNVFRLDGQKEGLFGFSE